jgi:diguanylate cyclase (GGDEF)-like protein
VRRQIADYGDVTSGVSAPSLRRACHVACALVAVIALVVFFGGWVAGDLALRTIVPGTVGMKWQTAVGLLALAAGLFLLVDPPSPRRRRLADAAALIGLLVGATVLAEYLFGWRSGFDEFLFRDTTGHRLGIAHPGRLAPTTALCLLLVGAALLLLDARPVGRWRPAELLVLPVAAVGMLTLIGYLYEIPGLYGPASAAKMALGTGVCVLCLATGVLLARPHGRLVSLATTDDPGGIMMRRLLPLGIALPLVLGWIRLRLGEAGIFGDRAGTWWLAASTAVVLTVLIARVAAQLSLYAARGRVLEAELVALANHDALTGLYNRRRFDQELAHVAAVAARAGIACSLLIIELDRLKVVNDSLGHAAGDRLLQDVAGVLTDRLREADVAARIGGDEFGVLLPATTVAGACVLAQVLCDAVAALRLHTEDGDAWTTISVGVAALGAGTGGTLDAMVRADQAMYRAKRAGGGQVARGSEFATPV